MTITTVPKTSKECRNLPTLAGTTAFIRVPPLNPPVPSFRLPQLLTYVSDDIKA
jgi:hypothetical protein